MKLDVSVIIPVHNEEKLIKTNINKFLHFFARHPGVRLFEIIIIENGSTDNTLIYARTLARNHPQIKIIALEVKSLGLGLYNGIARAAFPYVYFLPVDNPFHFTDFKQFITLLADFDLIFASKNHPRSAYENLPLRKIASYLLSRLTRLFFGLRLTDTQGTFMGKKDKLKLILPSCSSKSAFFQTQLALYAVKNKMKVTEVPVRYLAQKRKRSNFSIIRDGPVLLFELLREKLTAF